MGLVWSLDCVSEWPLGEIWSRDLRSYISYNYWGPHMHTQLQNIPKTPRIKNNSLCIASSHLPFIGVILVFLGFLKCSESSYCELVLGPYAPSRVNCCLSCSTQLTSAETYLHWSYSKGDMDLLMLVYFSANETIVRSTGLAQMTSDQLWELLLWMLHLLDYVLSRTDWETLCHLVYHHFPFFFASSVHIEFWKDFMR